MTQLVELHRSGAQEVVAIGLDEQQQVIHQPGEACDLSLHQMLDALELLGGERPVVAVAAGEDIELTAQHGQRRAQLVGGVGHELALRGERRRQPVEHVVECLRQHLQFLAGAGRAAGCAG